LIEKNNTDKETSKNQTDVNDNHSNSHNDTEINNNFYSDLQTNNNLYDLKLDKLLYLETVYYALLRIHLLMTLIFLMKIQE